jgi:hypothetical protein
VFQHWRDATGRKRDEFRSNEADRIKEDQRRPDDEKMNYGENMITGARS